MLLAGIGGAFLALVAGAVWMGQRPPAIDGDSIWTGEVTRGELVHEVVAPGRLVATDVRAVTNSSSGVVEQLMVLPGDRVEAGAFGVPHKAISSVQVTGHRWRRGQPL